MDPTRFDAIARVLASRPDRRSVLQAAIGGALAAALGGASDAEAGKKNKKRKKKKSNCPQSRRCGKTCCGANKYCCNPKRGVCCAIMSQSCCNVGEGTGTCCSRPNTCGKPWGKDAADSVCCPEKRQWFTTAGLVRCCPAGTVSLGRGISTNGGPCCPQASYCGNNDCCGEGQVCCKHGPNDKGRCCDKHLCLGPGLCCAPGAEIFCPDTNPHCAFGPRTCCKQGNIYVSCPGTTCNCG
ncbi:MAG: hypothetical protein IT337_11705 [Thermomicrobiales bacterium]|nr:hypothetical protein [Thermomicrobiales bacterium]